MARKTGWEFPIYVMVCLALSGYFAFSAIQGPLGVVTRVETEASMTRLSRTRDALAADVATLSNKTERLSDSYLDLDLLDERARSVLGYMRTDDLAIR
ncbi:FtsB family cell division protein [Meridianimarinicoccus sp. RP-17]|uniref:FtsB family cell division protein n=1 Tax=Meridianimarinicoccus zhengii TaxID=2056810 RepID=UPI000DADA6B2|nr:septum formation initiator family protein [Phycocomes zhengii]